MKTDTIKILNKPKTILLIIILGIATFESASAQQDPQYTQYIYNTIAINPAYAGSRGVLSIAGLYRAQWIGLDGAPNTQTLNFHSPISERVGLGLSIVNDEIGNGTNQNTNFDAVVSYNIQTSRNGKLSFGAKVGGQFLNIDFNQLANYVNEVNYTNFNGIERKFSPNIGAGIYYNNENFYAGLSVPNFLKTKHFDDSAGSTSFLAEERLNIYLMTGYIFELNPRLKFKPAALVKSVNGAPLQVDISTSFLFNDKFTLGAAYRWSAAFSAMFGFQISEQFMLGLAYDRETSSLGNSTFNDGSFEIILRYEFFKSGNRIISPRFF